MHPGPRTGRSVSALFLLGVASLSLSLQAQTPGRVDWDPDARTVVLASADHSLELRLRYHPDCRLDQLRVRGIDVLSPEGVWTGAKTPEGWTTTRPGPGGPGLSLSNHTVTLRNLRGQAGPLTFVETWQFTALSDQIQWGIERTYESAGAVDDLAMPAWNFANRSTWTGAILGHGGVAWTRLFDRPNASYGVHTGDALFWNRESGTCLRVRSAVPPTAHAALRFTRQSDEAFSAVHSVTPTRRSPRDGQRRFLRERPDVWAATPVSPGTVTVEFTLRALAYDQAFDRGDFRGLHGDAIREILNTIARIGAIDDDILGSNGYYSGYAVLHEPWIAQLGLAINDPGYVQSMSRTLDTQRDHAIGPDGRVKSRWSYDAGDALPGTYDAHGFYECQWGWLLDSQPSHVINVAEQFDLSGDLEWVRRHKTTCERVLDYLLRRDRDDDGLVEMLTDSHREARGSDWIDIIWAAHENAFVNAQLFHALQLWADVEEVLGDADRASDYRRRATRLQQRFNADTAHGGFWDADRSCYVHWRDRDDSLHGRNRVVPVNFMAIAYGLCEPPARARRILEDIETRMQREGLFFWPICFESYAPGEGADWQFPFPNYENGDLFLAWGETGVRAYATERPDLAVKYIRNVLDQYERDGLICQRYLRSTQQGAGDDLLANNCSPIVGLYRNIYGIQPRWNRLVLDPHLVPELRGTTLIYTLRDQRYVVGLGTNDYRLSTDWFSLRSGESFGLQVRPQGASFFPGTRAEPALTFGRPGVDTLEVHIPEWPADPLAPRRWTVTRSVGGPPLNQRLSALAANRRYQLLDNDHPVATLTTDALGEVVHVERNKPATVRRYELRPVE